MRILISMLAVFVLLGGIGCVTEEETERALHTFEGNAMHLIQLKVGDAEPIECVVKGSSLLGMKSFSKYKNSSVGEFLVHVEDRDIEVDATCPVHEMLLIKVVFSQKVADVYQRSGVPGLKEEYFSENDGCIHWGHGYLCKILLENGVKLKFSDMDAMICLERSSSMIKTSTGRLINNPDLPN